MFLFLPSHVRSSPLTNLSILYLGRALQHCSMLLSPFCPLHFFTLCLASSHLFLIPLALFSVSHSFVSQYLCPLSSMPTCFIKSVLPIPQGVFSVVCRFPAFSRLFATPPDTFSCHIYLLILSFIFFLCVGVRYIPVPYLGSGTRDGKLVWQRRCCFIPGKCEWNRSINC